MKPDEETEVISVETPLGPVLLGGFTGVARFKQALSEDEASETCIRCGSDRMDRQHFRDKMSWDESQFSFLCQHCQDVVFGEEERLCFDGRLCDWPGSDCSTCPWMDTS